MNKIKNVSLQTKILTLITSLILVVIILLTGIYSYLEVKQTEKNMGKLALQVSTTVSFMPSIKEAFHLDEPATVIQPIAEHVRKEVGAEFVVVGNKDSIRYAHPDPWKLGKRMVGGDNKRALVFGQYYTSKAVGSLGPSLRGKSPIFDEKGNIIGIVSVGFLIEDIRYTIYQKLFTISKFSLVVLLFGIIGGVLLARNVRRDTLGLEPHEIAALYRERSAILLSIREGVIAVDEDGLITMMNHSARDMLGLSGDCMHQPIKKVLPNTQMVRVLDSGVNEHDQEMYLNHRCLIVNREMILENGRIAGVVSSFRDKTEIQEMIDTISEVRQYSEDLRAQTHEYTNKLYVLSGLIQLGHYQEAVEMIQSESETHATQNHILFDQINDSKVQAVLLGKIGKASEKKINFSIDKNSSLDLLPGHLEITNLIVILGNIIDNAFEAVDQNTEREVIFFTTDIGNDVVFEVADNGQGIDDDNQIFEKGYSTKSGNHRGYGLANVKDTVEKMNGTIETKNLGGYGTAVTVFLPKEINQSA